MKFSVLLLVVFTITAIKYEGTEALTVVSIQTAYSPVQVKDPSWGSSSSGILKSHTFGTYATGMFKNLTLSAPPGYGIVAAFRMIDLRPNNLDKLMLSSVGTRPVSYNNAWSFQDRSYDSRETLKTFFAPNGKLVVTFETGRSLGSSVGYDGFQLTYTSYSTDIICRSGEFRCSNRKCIANILTCDGHNHCGDGSDQFLRACSIKSSPNVAGIVCGVIFLLIAVGCAVFLIVRRARRNAQTTSTTVVTSHPLPPNYQPPAQPGTGYPPPPPQYSQYPQGQVNPTYR